MSKRIDLSLFRGDESDDNDDSLPVKPTPVELNLLKSRTFAHGVTSKTKRDLEKEAEERKQAEEEAATKRALEEFARSFDGPSTSTAVSEQGTRSSGRNVFVRAGEKRHPHSSSQPLPASRFATDTSLGKRDRAHFQDGSLISSTPPHIRPHGKRVMDAFQGGLKSNEETRDARQSRQAQSERTPVSTLAAYERGHKSLPETTNICVTNLPEDVQEADLGWLFAEAGPVGTLKIMWPQSRDSFRGRDRRRPQLVGFVSFMKREDAERALQRFDDYMLKGHRLRLAWSKPVPIPPRPAYDFRGPPRQRHGMGGLLSQASSGNHDQQGQHVITEPVQGYWFDQVTKSEIEFIEEVATRVRAHGDGLIVTLRQREKDNPSFRFLFDENSPQHHVFNYLLDSGYVLPPTPSFAFDDEGYASIYSSDSDERADSPITKNMLGKLARRRFEAMLRGMTGRRAEIARAMEFAVKRADVAEQIVEIICSSLRVDDTPVPRKMARLHLVSDVLHNSSSTLPNVWRYRQFFEKQLPAVFEHFALVRERLLSYSGTLSATVFLQQADAVLDVWDRWMVFTTNVLNNLRQLLRGQSTLNSLATEVAESLTAENHTHAPTFKSAGFKSSFKRLEPHKTAFPTTHHQAAPDNHSTFRQTDLTTGNDEDVDGEVMGNIDGDALDGEVMVEGETDDVDGEPMLNVDGEAMLED